MLAAFDLDDTLMKEADFVHSAYAEIARQAWHRMRPLNHSWLKYYNLLVSEPIGTSKPFDALAALLNNPELDQRWMLEVYRNHRPEHLSWEPGALRALQRLKDDGWQLALITDGRSATQRAKIKALGLDQIIPEDNIYISGEHDDKTKYEPDPWLWAQHLDSPCAARVYVGNNPLKDFYLPNQMGWRTVQYCGNEQRNIPHPTTDDHDHQAHTRITSFDQLLR